MGYVFTGTASNVVPQATAAAAGADAGASAGSGGK